MQKFFHLAIKSFALRLSSVLLCSLKRGSTAIVRKEPCRAFKNSLVVAGDIARANFTLIIK